MSGDVLVFGGLRTPHGRHGGALRDVPVVTLATHVASTLLDRTGVPADVLERIHGEVVTMLDKPQVRDKLLQSGAVPVGAGPGPFSQRIRSETEKWGALLKQAGVQNQ